MVVHAPDHPPSSTALDERMILPGYFKYQVLHFQPQSQKHISFKQTKF